MSEQPMDRMVEAVREAYHAPGDTPREAMWEVIQQGLPATSDEPVIDMDAARKKRAQRTSAASARAYGWAVAAAAVLVIVIGIGRMTSPVPDAVPAASAPGDVAQGLRFAAAEHFGRTESLLTMVRADARRGQVDPMTGTWARGLLAQTRLLIDARVAGEPAMDELLEDLELVLAQIVGLAGGGSTNEVRRNTELALAIRGLEERELLPRLQAAGPALGLSGT